MDLVVDDLERQTVADALVSNHAALVAAECRELVLAAQWADLHPAESLHSPVMPGMVAALWNRFSNCFSNMPYMYFTFCFSIS